MFTTLTSLVYLVLKDMSVAPFLASVPQEKYYVFPICSQEKFCHLQGNSQEKSGKNIRYYVYGTCGKSNNCTSLYSMKFSQFREIAHIE